MEMIEHYMVIDNMVAQIGAQVNSGNRKVFGANAKYKWFENYNKPVVPDFSINCDVKNRRTTSFMGVPRFIAEVLSEATENGERTEKMELYRKVEVEEYWIIDYIKKQVEIYKWMPIEDTVDDSEYVLYKTVTEDNKGDLELLVFPNVKISFDELFDL